MPPNPVAPEESPGMFAGHFEQPGRVTGELRFPGRRLADRLLFDPRSLLGAAPDAEELRLGNAHGTAEDFGFFTLRQSDGGGRRTHHERLPADGRRRGRNRRGRPRDRASRWPAGRRSASRRRDCARSSGCTLRAEGVRDT